MKRIVFQYIHQNEDYGPTGGLKNEDSATSKLRPEENNTVPGTEADDETKSIGKTTPDMDAHSSAPGTGDMSGRAGSGESGPVTGG